MPTYEYFCTNDACFHSQEEDHSMNGFKEYRPKCEACGSECEYRFTPSVVQFALKDGPSGSWPSKGNRFKDYRNKKSQEMERRQKDRYGHINRDATPNYQGHITESWREAQSLAMADKDRQAAIGADSISVGATYNEKISKEKAKSK